jgi:hypothetical protein
MKDIIDAEAKDQSYTVTITILMPSNQKATLYPITVKAGDQIEAMARAIEEWKEKTSPENFQTVDVKKVK